MESKTVPPSPRSLGRPRSIDRNRLLDAAEEIVARDGAGALSIDAVAKATGVTKGGVQYAFGTKEALVEAMFERWIGAYDAAVHRIVGADPCPRELVRGHLEATRRSDAADNAKSAALLAALMRSPERLAQAREWYRDKLRGLNPAKADDRQARLAFVATEGIFMLRFFGLVEMDEDEWQDILTDVAALLPGEGPDAA